MSSRPAAGKHALVAFSGQRGDRVALRISTSSSAFTTMRLFGPDGRPVGPSEGVSVYWGGMLDTQVLPGTGTYTIQLVPSGATKAANLAIHSVAPDTAGEIEASGPSVGVTTATPGQNHRLSFEGAAGQRVSLRVNGLTYPSGMVTGSDGSSYYTDDHYENWIRFG